MPKRKLRPRLLFADEQGRIYDHPDLLMLMRRGHEQSLPRPDELIPLPEESELFLLPGRSALGLDPESGRTEALEETAVAAFISPGHTLTGTAAYHLPPQTATSAPTLPMFSYGAVGFARGKLWVAAQRVDPDIRQIFTDIPKARIQKGAKARMARYPKNRLFNHLMGCALTNCCPAARNLCLGRYEAPLPTAQHCNARCIGCLSRQPEDSGFPAVQQRIDFRPTPNEIVEVMTDHAGHEKRPIFSFGQGCEGDPLTEAELLAEATALYRKDNGPGTVNINTNGGIPASIPALAEAGVDSLRISLNSVREPLYTAYYRPSGYSFPDVVETIQRAKERDMFISLNLLVFPGITDTEEELAAMIDFVNTNRVDYIQMRNLNLDPDLYLSVVGDDTGGPHMGLKNFMKRLGKECPRLEFGYFNPYLEKGDAEASPKKAVRYTGTD